MRTHQVSAVVSEKSSVRRLWVKCWDREHPCEKTYVSKLVHSSRLATSTNAGTYSYW